MLTLASESRVRIALLRGAGLAFDAVPARVNERQIESQVGTVTPSQLAQRLAEAKAMSIRSSGVVIGADQVLELDGIVLHKTTDAAARLDALRGRSHTLNAGVALARDGALVWSTVDTATLTMHPFTDAERDQVLALEGPDVISSVGAYRLEGPSVRLFERVAGDYFTILGLPLLPLLAALRAHAPETLQ